jgi:argininosuccinate synthase
MTATHPRVVLAYSGGLDTSFALVYLRKSGARVLAITVDTGGFEAAEREVIADRARRLGADEHRWVDARDILYERYLRFLIYANAQKGGLYPFSVSAERTCQAAAVAELAVALGADQIVDAATGAGNDQVRFGVAFAVLAPSLEHRSLIRELGISRDEEAAFLAREGFEEWGRQSRYSVNQGLWGTTIGGGETHDPWQTVPDAVFPGGIVDPARPARSLTIEFRKGDPVPPAACSGPVALIGQLNALGSGYGIGRGIHLGETILGIKGRVVFEAPAAAILIAAHRELEKLVLGGSQSTWKETLGALYGSLVHEGRYFDPLARDLEAFLASSQERVTGQVRCRLEPGRFVIEGVRSPHGLVDAGVACYGESPVLWSGSDAAGFTRIYGVAQRLWARAGGANVEDA